MPVKSSSTRHMAFSSLHLINSFFILLISLLTGEERRPCTFEELLHVAQYWLSFLRASLGGEFIPTVMIAASQADCCPDGQGLLQQVVSHLRDVFEGKIIIREECFLLDCRKSWSPGMQQLRELLKQVRDEYMQVSSLPSILYMLDLIVWGIAKVYLHASNSSVIIWSTAAKY